MHVLLFLEAAQVHSIFQKLILAMLKISVHIYATFVGVLVATSLGSRPIL